MKIEHVTINVADLENSVAFYRDILELKIQSDMRESAGMPIVFLANEDGETCIELIQNATEAFSGSGITVGFGVAEIETARSKMCENGLNPSPIISPIPGTRFFFIKDPDGLSVQLIQQR